MKPAEIATIVLAGGALVLSGVQFLSLGGRLSSLETRAGRLEAATPAAPPAPKDYSRDIAALRADVESLKLRATTAPAVAGGTPVVKGGPLTLEQAQAKQEDAEKQQKEWMARQVRAMAETLEQKLGLSAQQKSEVSDVLTNAYADMAEKRRQAAGASEPMKDILAKSCAETDEKIRAVLTAEQQQQYTELTKGPAGIFGLSLNPTAGRLPGEEGSSRK